MSILIEGMTMPKNCDNCWALDDYGDYPRCRITDEQRGYSFPVREKRMDKCPLVELPLHGRWIEEPNCFYRCSKCGEHYPSIKGYMSYNFCPNCGVDMRGEEMANEHWISHDNGEHAVKVPIFTNADRIRAMTDEELAKYLDGVCHDLWQMFVADSEKMWLEWLRKEAE